MHLRKKKKEKEGKRGVAIFSFFYLLASARLLCGDACCVSDLFGEKKEEEGKCGERFCLFCKDAPFVGFARKE